MGKIRTRFIGNEEIEKKQIKDQKERSKDKKKDKIKVRAPGQKGGERSVVVEQDQEMTKKLEKAKKLIEKEPEKEEGKKKIKKVRKRGKNFLLAKREIDKNTTEKNKLKLILLQDAIALLKKTSYTKFDETVEIHIKVIKEGLRGEVDLPHPTGKKIRVKIVDDVVLDSIERGKIDFDVLITHPSYMGRIAKLAKILGPKGLMPNPKSGTISDKPEELAKKYEKGIIKWKTEAKAPLIHQIVGKLSYDDKKILDNIKALIDSIGKSNIVDLYITSSMSPSIKVDISKI